VIERRRGQVHTPVVERRSVERLVRVPPQPPGFMAMLREATILFVPFMLVVGPWFYGMYQIIVHIF
jgi:hypothetical protein